MKVYILDGQVHKDCGGQVEQTVYEITGTPGEGPYTRRCLKCGEETVIFRHQVQVEPAPELAHE